MAFHQPTPQATQRVFRPAVEDEERQRRDPSTTATVDEFQTWVLFSPPTDAGTTASYLTATHKSNTTPGRSRLSDLGSLNTVARSDNSAAPQPSPSYDDVIEEDEDAELDSLDSHLPEFRSTPNFFTPSQGVAHATPVVPAHDGLGSFRLDHEGMGQEVQDRLYAFEQYNPRRIKRRRESLERVQAHLEHEQEHNQEMDKMRRIESWRIEHSRYLLEEIQKETRRRTRSIANLSGTRPGEKKTEDTASSGIMRDVASDTGDQSDAWHDQQVSDFGSECEGLWGRITRKVICDLMGIDDKMLSILFGESFVDGDDMSTTPKGSLMKEEGDDATMENSTDSSWQHRILERVAKELGLFVHHQMSEHPGAFSTFTRIQQMPIPYAGLPPIPESANDSAQTTTARNVSSSIPEFKPTIPPQSRPIDVPNTRPTPDSAQTTSHIQSDSHSTSGTFTQEEWEQDLDVRLVFRYLRSHFMSRSTSSGSISGNAHLATSSTQDMAAKAARVRQHHPLVSKTRPAERRSFKAASPSSPVHLRHASSCASQSTRRSVRRSSCSSRHYWDIGAGSVGTGSLIAAAGPNPMGSWGEV